VRRRDFRERARVIVDEWGFFVYFSEMHEMSLLTNILTIVRDSLRTHELTRLISVKICYGELAQIVPDALVFAFEALTTGTDLDGAVLELERIPLQLSCGACDVAFFPEASRESSGADASGGIRARVSSLVSSCPACGTVGGHKILAGKELYVAQMEAE